LSHRIKGSAKMADSKPTTTGEVKAVEKKWTRPLADAGWTALPNVIFERQHALGLDPLDINIILHLASYWWKAGNDPYPSKSTIAAAIGVNPRTVQRHIAKLEAAGFVSRTARSSKKSGRLSNQYSFTGLIKECTPFALERIEEKKKRMSEATARAKRKRPLLTVVR
jgi:predicted transcriptional regulator